MVLDREGAHRPSRPGGACSRSSSRRSQVELDGDEDVPLEAALAQLHVARPRRAPQRRRGRHRGARARPAHARVRLQHAARRQVDRRPAAPLPELDLDAATSPTRPATSRCRRSSTRCSAATRSRSAGTRSRPSCSASTGSPTTTAWRRSPTTRRRSAGRDGKELVLDAYESFSPELADVARRFFDEPWIDAPRAAGQAPGRVLRVHGAVAPPVPAAQLHAPAPRRAHARPRARPRPARLPGRAAGRLPPDARR